VLWVLGGELAAHRGKQHYTGAKPKRCILFIIPFGPNHEPILSLSAIHFKIIVVWWRNRLANSTFNSPPLEEAGHSPRHFSLDVGYLSTQ
jgi:hypothetical protein